MKIVSQAQAGFLGAVASGRARGKPGLTASKAHTMLKENRGLKLRGLPVRASERPAIRRPSRTPSRRGGR